MSSKIAGESAHNQAICGYRRPIECVTRVGIVATLIILVDSGFCRTAKAQPTLPEGRALNAGLRVEFRKVIETGRLVGVGLLRIVRLVLCGYY